MLLGRKGIHLGTGVKQEAGISVAHGRPALLNSLDTQGVSLSCALPAFLCLCPPSLLPQQATPSH